MVYYIFLKSLRSLEEFRKNPHVKIPPKFPSTNIQSLAVIKNQIFIRKRIFLHFRPIRPPGPRGQPAHSASWPTRPPDFLPPHRVGRAPPLPPPAPPRHGRRLSSPPLPTPGSCNGHPPITPPPFTPGNGSHEGANYRRHPRFPAAPASLPTL
jgi:hypothetical protein